jgi:DUF971 family protein
MKEDYSFSRAEIFQLNEARTSNINRAIMVPFGYPKNFDLCDRAELGDFIHFKDGKVYKIKARVVLFVQSPMAECMAQMIYNKTMKEVLQDFQEKHKRDIQLDKVAVIIYNAKEEKL